MKKKRQLQIFSDVHLLDVGTDVHLLEYSIGYAMII